MIAKIFLIIASSLILIQPVVGEPWLANRYAQNCAGCHAPGRANRVPKDRRCTLSCQGCHTNPNGGGMRNHYGLWNSQRWLRSKYSKKWKNNKPTPASYSKQVYAPLLEATKLSDPVHKKMAAKVGKKKAKRILKKHGKKIIKKGYALKTVPLERVNEKDFDKYNDTRWKYNNKSKLIDLASATDDDPIRLNKQEWFRPSLEARLFYISATYPEDSSKDFSGMSAMAFDLGAEIKPFAHNYKFVFESRYANSPKNSQWDTIFNSGSFTKSAYLLVDDLPYNTYVMYGLFRPMFGYYDPNHVSLAQEINGLAYNGVVKGVSMGAAPNVPFANLHIITPKAGSSSKEEGIAINLGARFVTLGASAVFSYWKTEITGTAEYDREMWTINLGGYWRGLTANFDLMRYDKIQTGSRNGGTVTTVDLKYRVFKENYLVFNYASANVAKDLTEGSASDLILGWKTFLYSGVELEAAYSTKSEVKSGVTDKVNYLQTQLHLYF